MNESIYKTLESLGLMESEPIERRLTYFWVGGCKFLHVHDVEVTEEEITRILDSVSEDGKSYPFNSNYLVIVAAETSLFFKDKDLYFMREGGENVVFILFDKTNGKVYYPKGFNFPLRFSYRKILKAIAEKYGDQ